MDLNNSNRIIYYDLIRTFAIFGVLACHVFAELVIDVNIFNTKLWYYSLCLNSLRDVSVPLFVCVSGALLINKKEAVTTFIKKRFSKVVIPYIFWAVTFILFEVFINHQEIIETITQTISLHPVGKAIFLWFVPMILSVYLMIIILNKLIQYNHHFLKLGLILSVLFFILINFNVFPYSYSYFIVYAIFGYQLSRYDFSENKLIKFFDITEDRLTLIFLILSILFYFTEVYLNAVNSIRLNTYSAVPQFGFLNIALVISVFLFFRYFTQSKGKFNIICKKITKGNIGKIIFSISFCSYGIYLSHIIIRNLLLNLSLKNYFSPSIFYTGLLISVLLISWLIILLMSKIPILKKFSGR